MGSKCNRSLYGTTDWLKIGKGVGRGYIYCFLVYMQNTSHEMLGWMNHKLESRLPEEISTTSDTHDTTLIAESEEKLKSLLIRVKGE